ncbi:MAG: hypothetical protein ACR2PL_24890 [Dehalococcoidia bacterium]
MAAGSTAFLLGAGITVQPKSPGPSARHFPTKHTQHRLITPMIAPGSTLLQRALRDGFEYEQPQKAFLYREIQSLNPRRPADFLAPPPGWTGAFTAYIADSGVPML